MSRARTAAEERAWQAVRQVVLERDGYCCRECGAKPSRQDLDVHHLIRRADGGRDEASNCVTLCDGCHAARHPSLQVSLSRRMIERWALRIARFVDRSQVLTDESRALVGAARLFGVERFRDGQLDVVLAALRGESLLVIRPTGAGKSLCFQLPAVLAGQPASVVLSPLKALMRDQVGALLRLKLPATFINSDVSRLEKERRYELLEAGAFSLVYLAPERFNPERVPQQEIDRINQLRPRFLVVDEAHLVDRWGDDFRIDYSRIAEIRRQLGNPPVLAFTATAGVRTQERIKHSLGIPDARTLVSGVDRPNIALIRITESSDAVRARIVARLIRNLDSGRLMVFVPTTNVGRRVQEALRAAGCDLPLYHARLPAPERDGILGRFTGQLEPPIRAVICTSAFSMGLDVPDVRVVVNWQHPAAVEDYLQEFGRAGRDGRPALALLFRDRGGESGLLKWMADKTAEQVVADGSRTFGEAQEALAGKHRRIDEISRIVQQDQRCFRAELNEALAGPACTERRPWSTRILDWAFTRPARVRPADACCDICSPETVDQLRAGCYAPQSAGAKRSTSTRSKRRSLISRRRLVAGAAGLVFVLVAAIAVISLLGRASPEPTVASTPAAIQQVFERYTGAFSQPGEFARPTVTTRGDNHYVCARHVRDGTADPGRYDLCLLVDLRQPQGRYVIGGFKHQAGTGTYDCYGQAEQVRDCRP